MGDVVEFVNMNIGDAIGALRAGHRVRRRGWNGKGMWLAFVEGCDWQCAISPHRIDGTEDAALSPPLLPWIVIRTADQKMVPWLCSQTDLLATDWEILK